MSRNRWSEEDSKYLKENHGKLENCEIANHLGFSVQHIQRKANEELGFTKRVWDDAKISFLVENWDKMSYSEIAKAIDISSRKTVQKKASQLGFVKGQKNVNSYDGKDLLNEEWELIKDFEDYKISNMGRVVSLRSNTILIQNLDSNQYHRFMLWKNNKNTGINTHILVANYFLGDRPEGYQINHIDGNKSNNKVSNLEYITASENMKHAYDIGLHPGVYNSLNEEEVHQICKLFKENNGNISPNSIINKLKLKTSTSNIKLIKYRKTWVRISKHYKW